ncbi:YbbR-like domain-containing protein [Terrisporobacter glycolicus]|uniref:YbbR-like protein n=1 Tax=Terrisporobacter glycolicus ATCC 14880 = DSM 1288 TaxID=1121315 RepID=A0ABZ2F1C9_9FIRM|nr:CdaR family protein [Terrisporobacter glycolicus]
MKNNLKRNTRIKLISLLSAMVLWMYVMAIVDPEDTKLFENIPVTVTNAEELKDDDLVVYPETDLVADIYITGKLSDLQKISKEDIHIYGSINNPIEGKNYLYLKVNTTKQVSYEFKSDFIVVKLEKLVHQEKNINPEIIGEYKDDVDTVILQQSVANISGPRVLTDQVDYINATVQVDSKDKNKLTKRVKLIPVNTDGKEVKGVNLDIKTINAEVTFLEEKQVPINIQLKDEKADAKAYELTPEVVMIKGKKEVLDKINYINTQKIDSTDIGVSKKIDLIIPEGVTTEETTTIVKQKDDESLIQRLIYNNSEIELRNNTQKIKASDLNIPDSINVEVQLDDKNTKLAKSDISLYIDLENEYDKTKEYLIKYESDTTFKNVRIIPSTVGK